MYKNYEIQYKLQFEFACDLVIDSVRSTASEAGKITVRSVEQVSAPETAS